METTLTPTTETEDYAAPEMVNRSVLVMYFNEEFCSWYINTVDRNININDMLEKPHTFLIPPIEIETEVSDYISQNFMELFEYMLTEYIEDSALLEAALTEDNFDNWVDYNFSPYAIDFATEFELEYEESDEPFIED